MFGQRARKIVKTEGAHITRLSITVNDETWARSKIEQMPALWRGRHS